MRSATATARRTAAQVIFHLILAGGAIVFSVPFFWLVSSSFKEHDELYTTPPRWLPALPVAGLIPAAALASR